MFIESVSRFRPIRPAPSMGDTIMEAAAMSCGKRAKFCAFDTNGFIRFACRHFPAATAANLAAASGATVSTAEKWLRGETQPSGIFLSAMISAFGPAFLVACVPGARAWAGRAARDERLAEIEAERRALLAAE
jgi:hypothetical protein